MEKIERLVRELKAVEGLHYPDDLRRRVGSYIAAQRADKVTWKSIQHELGLANDTIRRWAQTAGTKPKFRRVKTTGLPIKAQPVTVVSPQGWRLESMDAEVGSSLFRELAR